jgi:hypothetical protein
LRLRLARDPASASWGGSLIVRTIGAWQRRVARARGIMAPRTRTNCTPSRSPPRVVLLGDAADVPQLAELLPASMPGSR